MKKSILVILSCILIVVLSMSMISAYDNETNISSDVDTFSQLDDNIKLTDENQTLNLEKDYKRTSGYTNGIEINKSITIDGKGHSIDAESNGRIFFIKADNVCLKNINFLNGKSNSVGGTIVWIGNNASIINCNFTNSIAQTAGGAVALKGANTYINNTIFQSNVVNSDQYYKVDALESGGLNAYPDEKISRGGGLYVDGSNQSILNSIFVNNKADTGKDYNSTKTTNTTNSKFNLKYLNNYFKDLSKSINESGDTLILDKDYIPETLNDECIVINKSITIIGNKHKIDGNNKSQIFKITADNVVLINITFVNGIANNTNGGAINWIGNNGKIINCNFTNNNTNEPNYGGAIYCSGKNTSIDSTVFKNNIAVKGGAIYYDGDNLTITSSNFTKNFKTDDTDEINGKNYYLINSHTSSDPIIYPKGSLSELSQIINNTKEFLILDNNYTNINDSIEGIIVNKSITIDGNAFTLNGNKTSRIFVILADNVTLVNIHFINGVAYNYDSSLSDIGGGAIYWVGANGKLINSTFTKNTADTILKTSEGQDSMIFIKPRRHNCVDRYKRINFKL